MEVRIAPSLGSPAGRHAATRAAALVQRLLLLDDLWTAQLDAAAAGLDTSAVEDVETLGALVEEMRECLANIGDSAFEVRSMLDELSEEQMAQALDAIGESPVAPSELRPTLEASLPDFDPRGAAITACDYILETAWDEAELLNEKLAAVERGERPTGDLRMPFKCAALLMFTGLAVTASIGLGGAPVFVGMAVAGNCGISVIGWTEARCPKLLPTISRHRR